MRRHLWSAAILIGAVGGFCSAVAAQDSVAVTPAGNDALSSYDPAVQRTRYVVDLSTEVTGWNNTILIGPVLKASRDVNPTFRTQVLGSLAVSPNLATGLTFAQQSYAEWFTAGAGVHPTANSAPGSVNASGFASQFGLAFSDFSLEPSSIVGATVGRVSGQFDRLFVERVVAASSRGGTGPADPDLDTATVSLGGVEPRGNVALRADNFNTLGNTANRVLGDNVVRVDLAARGGGVNTLFSSAGVNAAADVGATTYVVNNETTPTNTPTALYQTGVGPFVLAYDFAGRYRAGSNAANVTGDTSHISGLGLSGHRGNPSYSTITGAGGNAGAVASLAIGNSSSLVNRVLVFGLNYGSGGSVPVIAPGSPASYLLPQSITNGTFTSNLSGQAVFKQYLSQTPWRGGNGQVAIGQNAGNQLMLAATATDPSNGDFIAVATVTSPGSATWTVAAHPGQSVKNGPSGSQVGTIPVSGASFSAPAMDRLGNVYFIATWKPSLTPQEVGVFKAVNTGAGGYKLELLVREGMLIFGPNSTRPYTITSLTLNDSDSIASGSMFSQNLVQQQDPGATTSNPSNIRAFGGLVVSAIITYDNGGFNEPYDAVLYVGPTQGTDCIADFNGSGAVTVQDLFDYLAAWFAKTPNADINNSGMVTVQDLFDFLALWFARC